MWEYVSAFQNIPKSHTLLGTFLWNIIILDFPFIIVITLSALFFHVYHVSLLQASIIYRFSIVWISVLYLVCLGEFTINSSFATPTSHFILSSYMPAYFCVCSGIGNRLAYLKYEALRVVQPVFQPRTVDKPNLDSGCQVIILCQWQEMIYTDINTTDNKQRIDKRGTNSSTYGTFSYLVCDTSDLVLTW